MTGWERDKAWSDRFLPEIKALLGIYLIGEPPVEEDQQRNTDLVVLKLDAIRVACRIRTHEYWKFNREFTIRMSRPAGTRTELSKIIEGWGGYLFYGFSDEGGQRIRAWRLIDLNAFRLWFSKQLVINHGSLPGLARNNADGSSNFLAFCVDEMPPEIVVASGGFDENDTDRIADEGWNKGVAV